MNDVMYSSGTEHWSTPEWLFLELNSLYNFTLDACADTTNYKVKKYFSKKDNGLAQSWANNTTWVNPPYGREISDWVSKASQTVMFSSIAGDEVVMLLPARTDTKWMQEYVFKHARNVCFISGRLKFSNSKTSAPFPSMIVVFSNSKITKKEIEYFNSIGKNLMINEG